MALTKYFESAPAMLGLLLLPMIGLDIVLGVVLLLTDPNAMLRDFSETHALWIVFVMLVVIDTGIISGIYWSVGLLAFLGEHRRRDA
jgi:hypothetical protein